MGTLYAAPQPQDHTPEIYTLTEIKSAKFFYASLCPNQGILILF